MSSTALSGKLAASGARMGVYAGAETPFAFSGPRQEFDALRSGCAVLDLAWRSKLVVTGDDRARWLNGMVSNNTRDLPPDQGNYSFVLNAQGRIQGDLVAYNRGDHYLLETDLEQASKLREFLDRYIVMDDVELTDVSDKLATIAVIGPKAREVLAGAGINLPETEPYQALDLVWRDMGLSAARGPATIMGFELWMHPDNAAPAWEAIAAAGAIPTGTQALEWLRISLGMPRYGVDMGERELAQETGQLHALHFAKGCYIGQEIVERIRSRGNVHRIFSGFRVEGPPPERGAKIHAGEKEAGEITSAASVPAGDSEVTLALGYIRRESSAPGSTVRIGSTEAKVCSLPFFK